MDRIKSRVLQFAQTIEVDLHFFTTSIFGSEEFFINKEKITTQQIIDLAAMYTQLNLNWIVRGRGEMIFSNNEILIEVLEVELANKQIQIDLLTLQLKKLSC